MIKALHISLAYLTVAGFLLRAVWSFVDPVKLQQRWIKIAPHLVDTALFACGIYLAYQLYYSQGFPAWLGVKLAVLLGYILFGVGTLRGRGAVKYFSLGGALCCVVYIFFLAFNRQLFPW